MRTSSLRGRPGTTRLAAAVGSFATVLALLAAGPSASAASIVTIHPGDNVLAAMQLLRAGDTLQLAPGTYNTGYLRVTPMANGTAASPITITAADPANPPLLVGGLKFYSPTYLTLRSLRIQGNAPTGVSLTMDGGTGWVVESTEVFGAQQTNAMANVLISGTGGFPRLFRFSQNCVHDAANSTRAAQTDHNIYVSFQGSSTTSGTILRNLVWGAPHGENLKLGDGGVTGALGPWNVRVANNTFVKGGRQVLFHGNVRNNVVVGNLMYWATAPFVANPQTTQIYADAIGSGNFVSHTYWDVSSMLSYDPLHKVTYGTGNVHGKEPAFLGAYSCSGWRPSLAAAAPYGRWGTGSWTR